MKNDHIFSKRTLASAKQGVPDSQSRLTHLRIFSKPEGPGFFDLSSHKRAKDAIEFALRMRAHQFHVAVVGDDRSGRLSSTLAFLEQQAKKMERPNDWIYLNNFEHSYMPIPFCLPAGMGRLFKKKLSDLILQINALINQLLQSPSYRKIVESLQSQIQYDIDNAFRSIGTYAEKKGFRIESSEEGFNIDAINPEQDFLVEDLQSVRELLSQATIDANFASQEVDRKILEFRRLNLQKALHPIYDKLKKKFEPYLGTWIDDLENDILENIDLFINIQEIGQIKKCKEIDDRYSVNLFVDHTKTKYPKVYLEANPTFESVFGSIQYLSNPNLGIVETNYTMIKPGALHLANGGFLILRADALAKDPDLWQAIKSAIRDQRIRIHEKHRENGLPILDAPQPRSIPMDVQIFLVAHPQYYYSFLYNDPDFEAYFKIKAEIDPDMPLNSSNVNAYKRMLSYYTKHHLKQNITEKALEQLIQYSSKMIGHKKKLSAQIEKVFDLVSEASSITSKKKIIDASDVEDVLALRVNRQSRVEERVLQDIHDNILLIETDGKRVGQVNGLTVLDMGDHEFGLPSRITARTFVSELGIVNIERLTEMGGPIQQKGAFILQGFLNGIFAQDFPLSYGCSLTFEQSYSDVDGDSASVAELIAVLSSLSKMPVRQDIAITGSMNQFGMSQAVGGVQFKVESFYKVCQHRGLTGKQGVIIPRSNIDHLTLSLALQNDIDNGVFHIYPMTSIFDAINILFEENIPLINGMPEESYDLFSSSLFKKVYDQLFYYDSVLKKRER